MVGGVTKATGIFGTVGLEKVAIPDDPIRRAIGHVIKNSERLTPCVLPFEDPHYTIDDRLSQHQLHIPVVFASGFSRTGWGQGPLINAVVPWESVKDLNIVPLHMFRVVLEAAMSTFRPEVQEREGGRHKGAEQTSAMVPPLPLDASWLPQLKFWLPGSWTNIQISDKAVKSDNAVVDFRPWNQRIMLVLPCLPATIISFEDFALRVWKRRLTASFLHYLTLQYGVHWERSVRTGLVDGILEASTMGRLPLAKRRRVLDPQVGDEHEEGGSIMSELERDVTKGQLVLRQVLQSKWWEWGYGSSLFFWRWNGKAQIAAARDGMQMYVQSPLLIGRRRTKKLKLSPDVRELVAGKIEGMCKRFYLESSGHVANSLDYFLVPKGDSDIRVVFDGTSCGLNKTLWAPNFFLPSANSAVMLLTFGTWMADMDFGEMFHNFLMDEKMRRCAGVEFESRTIRGGRSTKMLRWTRLFMGMRPSPYNAVRYFYWGEEFARGDPSLDSNPMGYDCIRLNLPGMSHFDPGMPKVMKWRTKLGVVAGDVLTFVDDVRITGYSKENCHNVHRQFASRVQFLGMQDAPRKFRPPSQEQAGAWTGTIFKITPSSISKSVPQEKWNKGKAMVDRLAAILETGVNGRVPIDRKSLEKKTGFLNDLAMTFDVVNPYLKGFYLTLNSWRSHRDQGDWKLTDKRWKRFLFTQFKRGGISETELDVELFGKEEVAAPQLVTASVSLLSDVRALASIFGPTVVPVVGVRSRKVITVVYGFGDASGTGLGVTFTCGSGLNFRIGVWGSEEESESSNWKEFTNVVEALEEEGDEGHLDDAEVFMFTVNSTVESCVSRGSSSSQKLLGLVVRLQSLSLLVGIKINVFHVAGTRMIAQGTDGVSRGYLV
jgi:hypothetical protein